MKYSDLYVAQFTMDREITGTVRYFLKTQVLRYDYVVVGEIPSMHTRLPYEQKLERMHSLCIQKGYRASGECEKIRRRLYTEDNNAACPANLLLIESYLPDCIARTSKYDEQLLLKLLHDVTHAAGRLPCKAHDLHPSQQAWGEYHYRMCLPLDIHFLLIENDGALLAA